MEEHTNNSFERLAEAIRLLGAGEYDPELLQGLTDLQGDVGELARVLDKTAPQIAFREMQLKHLRKVIPIGVALTAEKDFNRILETIVVEAQSITNADGGTLYLLEGEEFLKFVILRNTSLGINMGGTSKNAIAFKPINLYHQDGAENRHNVASYSALTRQRVNIADAYEAQGFDFSGTKAFDSRTGYRSKSFLTYPLEDVSGKVIGVLQLINATDLRTKEIVPFEDDSVLEALVSLATAALVGYIREEELRREIVKLRIKIDESKRATQVAEITDTAYFRDLQEKAKGLRKSKE